LRPGWCYIFRLAVTRTAAGSLILYGALTVHGLLALGKLAGLAHLRIRGADLLQMVLGLAIPLLLCSHIIFTRGAYQQFAVNDTLTYLSGLIWGGASAWKQAGLLLVTWLHGALGVHIWLSMWGGWRRYLPAYVGLSVFVPVFALAGFTTEGRRATALRYSSDDTTQSAFKEAVNWPSGSEFGALLRWSDTAYWGVVGLFGITALVFIARRLRRPGKRPLRVTYVDGPKVKTAPGPTLLEISQEARVPHTALCGGRGRCTTCRVIVEDGLDVLPPPSVAEEAALRAVKAPPGTRLACQLRPESALTVYRVFREDGKRQRAHASQGKEARLAILFLDMRSFTARTAGQLPYDVVFLLNRFFDAIVPAIREAGGTVDKYMGDGLLAVFETEDEASSAKAGLAAARGIGSALEEFNEALGSEGATPVKIGLSLHLGNVVLGEIGAAGSAPRTLIGDAVNTASRLEGKTKELGVQALISAPLLEAAGVDAAPLPLTPLTLRGVEEPLPSWPVKNLSELAQIGVA